MLEVPKVVLFGDSLFQRSFKSPSGFGAALQDRYQRRFDVVSRGLSGYNTVWALNYVDEILDGIGGNVIAFAIFFGTNDQTLPGTQQHVNVEAYEKNLGIIVAKAQAELGPNGKIYVFGVGPCDEHKSPIRRNKIGLEYAAAALRVAHRSGAEFIDVSKAFRDQMQEPTTADHSLSGELSYSGPKTLDKLLSDGVHYTGFGYSTLLEAFLAKAAKQLDEFPMILPHYSTFAPASV